MRRSREEPDTSMRRPSRPTLASLYVATMIAVGVGVFIRTTMSSDAYIADVGFGVLLLLGVAVAVGELAPVKMPPGHGEVAPSTTFAFALLMTGGVGPAIIAQVCGSLLADIRDRKRPSRAAFNAAQYAIALWLSGMVLNAVPHTGHPAQFEAVHLPGIMLAGAVFFCFNSGAVALAVSLHTGTPLRRQLTSDLTFHAATEAILLGLAPLAVLAVDYSPVLLPLLVLPLVAINRAGRHAVLNEQLALQDSLTGLPNRVLFRDRAALALSAAERYGTSVVVMLIDLDRFKEINDTLGHHVGDDVLRRVATQLRMTLRESDTVARLGGDEFAILLDGSEGEAHEVAEKLRAAVAQPMDVAGISLVIDASIGIASSPEDGTDVETLMQRADVAMYQAKGTDERVQAYVRDRDDNSVARLTMAGELRRAIDDGDLEVHFQPQFSTRTGRMIGVEALARWQPDGHNSIAPDVFIPVAEQTGLIVPLTLHVFEAAARELSRWRRDGIDITVAVNLSARALSQGDLPGALEATCRRWDVPLTSLVMEVTETMIASDPHTTIPIVERLAKLGAAISIDDFGTGYSSLEYLKVLPVSEIKIDRAFVTSMLDDPRDAAIVQSTVELAHRLGLRVVAEGVENASSRAQLALIDCDVVQGHHFSRAVPAEAIAGIQALAGVGDAGPARRTA